MTPQERFAELWNDYLEGELHDEGQAELLALLDADESLRTQAADLFQLHRLLGFAQQDAPDSAAGFTRAVLARLPQAEQEFVGAVMDRLPIPAPTHGRSRFAVRTLAALACGLLLGAFVTSAAWVYAMPRAESPESVELLAESFESGSVPEPTGFPTLPNQWAGDFCEAVGVSHGVRPSTGGRMLRLLRGDYEGKPKAADSYVADIYYLCDLRSYRTELEDGNAQVQLSAAFNAATYPGSENYKCSLSLFALDAETATNGSIRVGNTLQAESLAYLGARRLILDRDPATWQTLSGELRLPPATDFVLARIGLGHATAAQRRPDFPGHYIDDVRLVLTRRKPLP